MEEDMHLGVVDWHLFHNGIYLESKEMHKLIPRKFSLTENMCKF